MSDDAPDVHDETNDFPPDIEGDCPDCEGTGEVCCSCGNLRKPKP